MLPDDRGLNEGQAIPVAVAMVNSNLLGNIPAPKRWEDFLDPKWKGKVAIADPNNNSTAYTIQIALLENTFPARAAATSW